MDYFSWVIWGGRWQEGSACSTGEEVEQINSHLSRCVNTTKYMLPEGTVHDILYRAVSLLQFTFCMQTIPHGSYPLNYPKEFSLLYRSSILKGELL